MLRKYDEWLKYSPGQILNAVIKVGGWTSVFPGELPRWAHRVRNYFNQEPRQLRYDQFSVTTGYVYHLLKMSRNLRFSRGFKEDMALSGHAYLDELKNLWFQMSAGATVYHFEHSYSKPTMAAAVSLRGQAGTPVFKLFSPDGSNGSRETIIKNPFKKPDEILQYMTNISIPAKGESLVKKGDLTDCIVKDPLYQGSYNYGETALVGDAAHTKFDVIPHEKDKKGYVNPPNRFSSIFDRNFPERANGEQIPLAKQEKY